MKTQADRVYPIILDIKDQAEMRPDKKYVFLYDDGHAFRAFLCDGVIVHRDYVEAFDTILPETAWASAENRVMVTIPSDTPWRLVHISNLELVSGGDIEKIERANYKNKKSVQKEMEKELKEEEMESEGVPALNQVPGVYL